MRVQRSLFVISSSYFAKEVSSRKEEAATLRDGSFDSCRHFITDTQRPSVDNCAQSAKPYLFGLDIKFDAHECVT